MTKKELLKALRNKTNCRELAEISRYNIDDCSMLVCFADISDELSVVYQAGEFSIDGCKILRNSDISEVSIPDKNENLEFVNMIYSKEGLFPKKADIRADSWASVFGLLMKEAKTVMVECSYDDATDYYFGRIKSADANIVQMQCFDGAGELFKDIVRINTDFVSSITFDDRYSSVMGRYVRWR